MLDRLLLMSSCKSSLYRYYACLLLAYATTVTAFPGDYLFKQGYYALSYYWSTKPVTKIIATTTDTTLRDFLLLSQQIKRFAVDSLGLVENNNYTQYTNIKKNYLVQVVTAAKSDTFAQYAWWFPLVGSVPYKGFFDSSDAAKELNKLAQKGLDTYSWQSGGYSSLGIVADPLCFFVQRYSPYEMANLIIHEQTHATLYVSGQAQFNEEFAMFVGEEGARCFIANRYGDTSKMYAQAIALKKDGESYNAFLNNLYCRLDSLYAIRQITKTERLMQKANIIQRAKQEFAATYTDHFVTSAYRAIEKVEINNAYLLAHRTYEKDLHLFYELNVKNGYDLKKTIKQVLGVKKERQVPEKFLLKLVEAPQ